MYDIIYNMLLLGVAADNFLDPSNVCFKRLMYQTFKIHIA